MTLEQEEDRGLHGSVAESFDPCLAHRSVADPEFPFEAARDLVGILGILWANERSTRRYSKKKLALITGIARSLKNAIRLAAGHDPGTAPYLKALNDANAAVKQLEDIFVDMFGNPDGMPEIVRTAGLRVKGSWTPWKRIRVDTKWAERKKRG